MKTQKPLPKSLAWKRATLRSNNSRNYHKWRFCFAEDKPEPQWFDAKYLEKVEETVSKAKLPYQDYNLLKSRLGETYSDGIYNLELDGLNNKIQRSLPKWFKNLQFNLPQRPKTNRQFDKRWKSSKRTYLNDLIDARKVKKLQVHR